MAATGPRPPSSAAAAGTAQAVSAHTLGCCSALLLSSQATPHLQGVPPVVSACCWVLWTVPAGVALQARKVLHLAACRLRQGWAGPGAALLPWLTVAALLLWLMMGGRPRALAG